MPTPQGSPYPSFQIYPIKARGTLTYDQVEDVGCAVLLGYLSSQGWLQGRKQCLLQLEASRRLVLPWHLQIGPSVLIPTSDFQPPDKHGMANYRAVKPHICRHMAREVLLWPAQTPRSLLFLVTPTGASLLHFTSELSAQKGA